MEKCRVRDEINIQYTDIEWMLDIYFIDIHTKIQNIEIEPNQTKHNNKPNANRSV